MYVKHYRFLFWQWQTDTIIANTVKHTHCVVVWIVFWCMSQKEEVEEVMWMDQEELIQKVRDGGIPNCIYLDEVEKF